MKQGSTKSATERRCYMNWGFFWVKCGTAVVPVKTLNILQTTVLLAISWKGLALEKGKITLVFSVCTKKRTRHGFEIEENNWNCK